MTLVVLLGCALTLGWTVRVLAAAVADNHRRGLAAIHQDGQSWQSR